MGLKGLRQLSPNSMLHQLFECAHKHGSSHQSLMEYLSQEGIHVQLPSQRGRPANHPTSPFTSGPGTGDEALKDMCSVQDKTNGEPASPSCSQHISHKTRHLTPCNSVICVIDEVKASTIFTPPLQTLPGFTSSWIGLATAAHCRIT